MFWIYSSGRLHDARRSHLRNVPKGFAHIVHDEPDYAGFLRGRIASLGREQLVVVYCRPDALATPGKAVRQLLRSLSRVPVPLRTDALVISDNGDLYGSVMDVRLRAGA